MEFKKANVLITGGSDGIGLGLAARFLAAGSNVIVTGRSDEKLQNVANLYPGLRIYKNDISDIQQREILAEFVKNTMPDINILINNAGIQRRITLASDNASWKDRQEEIDILFSAPVHLNHLLLPTLLSDNKASLIINVTSGGAYIPQAFAPIYSASKAALHNYTVTLRHSLSGTLCKVVELIPPAVQTSLAGPGLNHGAPLEDFCNYVFAKLSDEDTTQIGFGPTENITVEISGNPINELFAASVARFPVEIYKQHE
jgi:uncharacterized oxidoreductase